MPFGPMWYIQGDGHETIVAGDFYKWSYQEHAMLDPVHVVAKSVRWDSPIAAGEKL